MDNTSSQKWYANGKSQIFKCKIWKILQVHRNKSLVLNSCSSSNWGEVSVTKETRFIVKDALQQFNINEGYTR